MGISVAGQKLLFVPFARNPDNQTNEIQGTGLGLYIAKNLTEMQGGDMQVESRRGAGTTVYFTLPLAATRETPVHKRNGQPAGVSLG